MAATPSAGAAPAPRQRRKLPPARAETFEHGADIGVRGVGRTKAQAFEQAALALFSLVTPRGEVRAREKVIVASQASDDVILLADWLNGLILEMSVRRLALGRCRVRLGEGRLEGEAWGEPFDPARHEAGTEPKGATFTEARVVEEAKGSWRAQCVIDV